MKTMKHFFYLALLMFGSFAYAQVGIGTNVPLATLDVRGANDGGAVATGDGVLVPRVNDADMSSAANGDSDGQLVYNTTDNTFYFWNASVPQWQAVGSERAQVTAGTNVTVTGDGSAATPYVVSAAGSTRTVTEVNPNPGTYNVQPNDDIIYYTGSGLVIFNLPASVPIGKEFVIINNEAGGSANLALPDATATGASVQLSATTGTTLIHIGGGVYGALHSF